MIRRVGRIARTFEMINVYTALVGKYVEKKPLGRHKHAYQNNININLT
jgi:hypothetical protein